MAVYLVEHSADKTCILITKKPVSKTIAGYISKEIKLSDVHSDIIDIHNDGRFDMIIGQTFENVAQRYINEGYVKIPQMNKRLGTVEFRKKSQILALFNPDLVPYTVIEKEDGSHLVVKGTVKASMKNVKMILQLFEGSVKVIFYTAPYKYQTWIAAKVEIFHYENKKIIQKKDMITKRELSYFV